MKKPYGLFAVVLCVLFLWQCGLPLNLGSILASGDHDDGAVLIGAILAISGPASFLGAPEENALRMLGDALNQQGGIDGREVLLEIRDSGGSSENALNLAKELIEQHGVSAIIGPSTSGESLAIKDYCQEKGTVMISCGASVSIVDPPVSYVFKTPPHSSYAANTILEAFAGLGYSTVGLLADQTGFGSDGQGQFDSLAPGYEIQVLTERFDSATQSLDVALDALMGNGIEALVHWSTSDHLSLIRDYLNANSISLPVFLSHGYEMHAGDAGAEAEGVVFAGSRIFIAEQLETTDPHRQVLLDYVQNYEATYALPASNFGAHAYDALLLLKAAVSHAGSTDASAIRESLETMNVVLGVWGEYDFGPENHSGLADSAYQLMTVSGGEIVMYP